MPSLDVFSGDAFSTLELTDAINVLPNSYGRVGEIGLFGGSPRGVTTTSVMVEINNGVLNLLPSTVRGGPASQGTSGKRKMKSFAIPNFSHEDFVLADDVQNIRAFGTQTELMGVQDKVNEKLATMRNKHDITREWLRVTALRGVILDSDGSTLLDLFTDFGVSQEVIDFELDDDTTNVEGKCHEVSRHMEDNLLGDTMSGVGAFCSPEFFDALTLHPQVREAFLRQQGENFMRNDLRKKFVYQNIVFEEYRGKASDIEGNVRNFIPASDVRFFPLGTNSTFREYAAPADFMETVNTPGLAFYAKQERMDYDRGVSILTQMNPLPLVLRPALLVRGHVS